MVVAGVHRPPLGNAEEHRASGGAGSGASLPTEQRSDSVLRSLVQHVVNPRVAPAHLD